MELVKCLTGSNDGCVIFQWGISNTDAGGRVTMGDWLVRGGVPGMVQRWNGAATRGAPSKPKNKDFVWAMVQSRSNAATRGTSTELLRAESVQAMAQSWSNAATRGVPTKFGEEIAWGMVLREWCTVYVHSWNAGKWIQLYPHHTVKVWESCWQKASIFTLQVWCGLPNLFP